MAKEYFIIRSQLDSLIERLLERSRVVAPVEDFGAAHLKEITADEISAVKLSGYRAVEPFKSYLFKPIEKVSRYFGGDEPLHGESLVLLGARGCDLEALEVYDKVLLEDEFIDPFYKANREKVVIIGADCTDCGKTCFCTMVGGKPFPTRGFDLNLSPISDGYVVEAASEKGEKLMEGLGQPAKEEQLSERTGNRRKMEAKLDQNNLEYRLKHDLSDIHKRNLENKAWRTLAKDCVECSACNFICPSCTCFLLLDTDQRLETEDHGRYKVWDACLKAGYARVAGGANSRPKLYERLQNRYHCKFDYSFDRLGRYTCVGCGRCIDGCAGSIDMRKIFVELEKQAPLTAKLE